MKMNLKSVKNRLKDETLDLSLCDLEEVPVREIATIRKASHLDLSNNLLVSLPNTFATLTQIVKLDLSKNKLTEIPENFGEMKQLKSLDLYANQISRLPLSLSELKNLRWLDLKENPLTPAVASVAGPCSNLSECQSCAHNIVAYLSNVKMTIDQERLRRLNAAVGDLADSESACSKKESKKKKKKLGEKENKKTPEKNGAKTESAESLFKESESRTEQSKSSAESTNRKFTIGRSFCRSVFSIFVWLLFVLFVFTLVILVLPSYSKEQSKTIFDYIEVHTGIPVATFQASGVTTLEDSSRILVNWSKDFFHKTYKIYEEYFNKITTTSTSGH